MPIIRAKKKEQNPVQQKTKPDFITPNSPLSDKAMERLIKIMNDSPTIVKLQSSEWRITALKPGTQWLIAEEACKMIQKENMSMGDVVKEFASNLPSVVRVITLALLNDKQRINSDEYQVVFDQLMWGEYKAKDWITLLVEILNLLEVDFFFASTSVIQTVRNQALGRKKQTAELSLPERNTGR